MIKYADSVSKLLNAICQGELVDVRACVYVACVFVQSCRGLRQLSGYRAAPRLRARALLPDECVARHFKKIHIRQRPHLFLDPHCGILYLEYLSMKMV